MSGGTALLAWLAYLYVACADRTVATVWGDDPEVRPQAGSLVRVLARRRLAGRVRLGPENLGEGIMSDFVVHAAVTPANSAFLVRYNGREAGSVFDVGDGQDDFNCAADSATARYLVEADAARALELEGPSATEGKAWAYHQSLEWTGSDEDGWAYSGPAVDWSVVDR